MSASSFGTPIKKPWPRRWRYPVAGAVVALGAPTGLFVARSLSDAPWVAYAYGTAFALLALVVVGWLHGRNEDRLLETAVTDPLTGLHNRQHLGTRLQEEIARAERYHATLAALAIDVDRLKRINDTRGHAVGDRAIRLVADVLRESSRTGDLAARVGGDEFVVLAPSTTAVEALGLARRIRFRVAESVAASGLGPPFPSVSIGVADLRRAEGPTPEGILVAADKALYVAKARGGDRAVLARDSRVRRNTAEYKTGPQHAAGSEEHTDPGPFILSGSNVTTGRLPKLR